MKSTIKDRISTWMERLEGDARDDLAIAVSGYDLALSAYNKSKTTANHKAMSAARKALQNHLDALDKAAVESAPDEAENPWSGAPDSFNTVRDVAEFVAARWERGIRSVERDLSTKEKGHPRVPLAHKDKHGKYPLSEIMRYVTANGLVRKGETYATEADQQTAEDLAALKRREIQSRIEKAQAEIESLKRKNKVESGQLVPRSQIEEDLAARVRFFRSAMLGLLRSLVPEVAAIALESKSEVEAVQKGLARARESLEQSLARIYSIGGGECE